MSIEIREEFEVDAPIETVWMFVMDPVKVAPCLPGAKLEEVVDERNFLGGVKIKIGAISTQYKGKVELTEVDEATHRVAMTAEGRETSGGLAKALVTCALSPTGSGGTVVVVEATADLTGKVMQVGSRMIEGVSKQLFQQFAKRLRKKLGGQAPVSAVPVAAVAGDSPHPVPAGDATQRTGAGPPVQSSQYDLQGDPDDEEEALSVVPLLLRVIWDGIVGFFRRLFGR